MKRFSRVLAAAVTVACMSIGLVHAANRGNGSTAHISITPTSVDATATLGGTTEATLTIGNTGGSDLTWTIGEAGAHGGVQPASYLDDRVVARQSGTASAGILGQSRSGVNGERGSPVLLGADSLSQMADNTPVALSGMACGGQSGSTSPNSFWRRFYLSEHGSPASIHIASVTVGTEHGPSIPRR